MSQISDLLAAPLPDYYFTEHRLSITTERIDFTVPNGAHLLYAKERFEDPGVLRLCFEPDHIPTNDTKPFLMMIAGEGYVPACHYEIVKSVEMQDGLKWHIYLSMKD